MSIKPVRSERLDADSQVYFGRQLEYLKSKTYDVKYPQLKQRTLFPVSFEAGEGADTITYEQYDQVGEAVIINSYSDDLPRISLKGKEFTSKVKGLGLAFDYSVQDIRSNAKTGKNLNDRKALANRRGVAQKENKIALFGDSEYDLPGFLSNANIPVGTVPADGTGSSTLWTAKSADQIIRDVNLMINGIKTLTKGAEQANAALFPVAQFALMKTTPRSANSDTTILQFLAANHPEITYWDELNELTAPAGFGGLDVMVAYTRDPMSVTLEIPMDFMQHAPQERNLAFIINTEERVGGVLVYYPLSASFYKGI
jgi:hypothetical protein